MTNIAVVKTAMGALRRRIEYYDDYRRRICEALEDLIADIDTITERKSRIPATSPLGKVIIELKGWLDFEYNFELRAKMGIMYENFENKINWEA